MREARVFAFSLFRSVVLLFEALDSDLFGLAEDSVFFLLCLFNNDYGYSGFRKSSVWHPGIPIYSLSLDISDIFLLHTPTG